MGESQPLDHEENLETARYAPNWPKRIAGTLWIAAIIAGVVLLFTTETGHRIRGNPREFFETVRPFMHRHRLIAPAVFLGIYLVLAVGALPVWPLQAVGGMAFGLWEGVVLSLIASTVGAVISVAISRWIAADWFHDRIERKMKALRKLDETMGHNGFLVVMTVRLIHTLPFGLCNYALGLTRVSLINVTLGTFLGSIPAAAFYVGMGTPFHHDWKFYVVLATLNLILLLPLILRYLRPQWFRKIGVE